MIRIIHMADLHFGVEDEGAMALAAREIEHHSPDAIIVSGDLTQNGKKKEFLSASNWLAQFLVPKLIVPGNHDTPLINLFSRVVRPFGRFENFFARKSELDLDEVFVSGLNTARGWQARANWAEGSVDIQDLKAIGDVHASKARRVNIIACHHPFKRFPKIPMVTSTARGNRASEIVAEETVLDLALFGHVHTPAVHEFRHEFGSYFGVTCGTLSKRLRKAPPSFNVIDINEENVSVSVVAMEAEKVMKQEISAFNLEQNTALSRN